MGKYLTDVRKIFEYYKSLGEKSLNQLDDADLFWQYNEASNSIAIIINHLNGNMLSRWTDFLNSDGEKEWRQRDKEFENLIKTKSELWQKWEDGWQCLFVALDTINHDNFDNIVTIRRQEHTISEAINRQLAHYAYHIGQIVYIARMVKDLKWQSLSIPKNKSQAFNKKKHARGKHSGHFTDDIK